MTTGCFDKGGISRYSRYQIRALREIYGSKRVRVMSLLGPQSGGFEDPVAVDWHGGRHGLPAKLRFATTGLRYALADRPRIIHAAHVNLAFLADRTARVIGARTILNVYGLEVWSGLSLSRRRGLKQMDTVIADCQFTANYVNGNGMTRKKPRVIWDCVDLDRFAPTGARPDISEKYSMPYCGESFVLMTLGRLSRVAEHKGYQRLIRNFAVIAAKCTNCKLVIAGDGDLLVSLRRLAGELGIQRNVYFPGNIHEDDLPDLYRSATIFSLVSDRGNGRGEGVPLVALEAMACGIPVIVGNQDGSSECVVDSRNGFVLDPFDADGYIKLVTYLYRQSSSLDLMRIEARRVAEQFFGYPRFVAEHRDVYSDYEGESECLSGRAEKGRQIYC
jgi:phosphatidylinositol alpha-1,6-mannosyltransferase